MELKYRDPSTGELKQIYNKAVDTLPVGTIVEYDGNTPPDGYAEVIDDNNIVDGNIKFTGEYIGDKKIYRLFKTLKNIAKVGDNYYNLPMSNFHILKANTIINTTTSGGTIVTRILPDRNFFFQFYENRSSGQFLINTNDENILNNTWIIKVELYFTLDKEV